MNPGSIPCPNCGAAWDEECAAWCANGAGPLDPNQQWTPEGVDARANHLAGSIENRLAGRVASPSVSALPDGVGFELDAETEF